MSGDTRIGLALGGGGARGLAHIVMLEVFDELGLRPAVIAGTSIGALIGCAYAGGVSAGALRDHAETVLGNRIELARRLFRSDGGRRRDLIDFKMLGQVQVSGERLVELVLPDGVPALIEDMAIPFKVVTTDFYGRHELVLESGPVHAAVAASIALPGLISAPRIGGKVLIDGGITNPLPVDLIRDGTDFTVAIDVTGGPVPGERGEPTNAELAFGASQIMQRQIAKLKSQKMPPDIYVAPSIDTFRVLEFFKVHEILQSARAAKDDLKRALESRIDGIA